MKNKISKFKNGDIVRVLKGVKDPDFQINIGGWSGEIEDVDLIENESWLYTIAWDQDTLSVAGEDYVTKCENKNLDFERIYLEENELELVISSKFDENLVFIA
jgi:hypothetical protein